jgi:hypothetical protein
MANDVCFKNLPGKVPGKRHREHPDAGFRWRAVRGYSSPVILIYPNQTGSGGGPTTSLDALRGGRPSLPDGNPVARRNISPSLTHLNLAAVLNKTK